jgi:hypothetical protein
MSRRSGHTAAGRLVATVAAATVVATIAMLAWGAAPASAYWSASSTTASSGIARAATVLAGATPTVAVKERSGVTLTWAASTLSNGLPVGGYTVARSADGEAAQAATGGCAGTLTVRTCTETGLPDGVWRYTITPRVGTNWAGAASALSAAVRTDTTPPVNVLSRTAVSGGSVLLGTTLYYRGTAAGSLTLTNALTDGGSGPASSTTSALGGVTSGWSHTPGYVSTPAGGPFVSSALSWQAGTTATPTVGITGTDAYGNTAASTISFVVDNAAPTGGAISYADGYSSSATVPVTIGTIADTGTGVTAGGARFLQQSVAPLSGTTCGTYGTATTIVTNPAVSPATQDVTIANGSCYRFTYVFTDNVGNSTTTTSTSAIRLDNTPPTGGAISYADGYTTATSVTVTLGTISDSGTGVTAGGSRYLQQSVAPLSGNTCGTFGGFANVVTNPAATQSVTIASGNCYRFQYVFTDNVGNSTTTSTTSVVKARNYALVVAAGSPVNYYRLDDGTTSTVIDDTTAANNNGVWFNSPTRRAAGAIVGDASTAVTFDGVNDYGTITRQISSDFSIELWMKASQGIGTGTSWYNGAGLVDGEVSGVANDFGLALLADGRVAAGTGNPDATALSAAGNANGAWHHIVMTRTQSTGLIELYVDGVRSTATSSNRAALTSPTSLSIGRLQTGIQYFTGSLDEIALYPSVLTSAQVSLHNLSGRN